MKFNPNTLWAMQALTRVLKHAEACESNPNASISQSFRMCSARYSLKKAYRVPQWKCSGCGASYDAGDVQLVLDLDKVRRAGL